MSVISAGCYNRRASAQPPTGMPGSFFDVRIVSDVLTLATFGAEVRCVVRKVWKL